MSSRMTGGPTPRRALSGVAVLALTGAMFAPLTATADEPERLPGSPAPESKIQDGKLSGGEFVPNRYFIELAEPATAEGGSMQAIQSERQSFQAAADAAGVTVEVTSEYGTLWNGLAVTTDEGTLTDLAAIPQVEAIFPMGLIEAPERPEEASFSPQMFTAISMTGADVVHSELGFTGEGVKIGIIDTGVDYDHPDFGGSGTPDGDTFPTERVAYGYDFVGDSFNADPTSGDAYQPDPMPDEDPDDCQGHGTHVAGISSANGEVTGVAPDSTIGAYRVFGCEGSTTADIMLHAMEKSLEDGMDVVNLSIGSAFSSWKEYPTARATDALAREGVVVAASIGNSGANGLHSAGAPGVGEDTIGVGSVENTYYMANFFEDHEGNTVPYVVGSPAPEPPTEGTSDVLAVAEPGTDEARTCSEDGTVPAPFTPEQAAAIEGNWVLIQRGGCSFYDKALRGQEAGAEGVILYNNVPGMINPSVAGDPPITIPVIMINQADGERLVNDSLWPDQDPVTITWTEDEVSLPNPEGGLMSSFSSFGTMADTTVKPDLSAPGGQIYAPYPLESGGFATLSGTSMAAPHVAGAAALMLQADPDLSVDEVKTRLQNSSEQLDLSIAPTAGLEVVHRQGTGLIQVDDAILADTVIEPALVQLGQQLAGETSTQTVTVTNTGDEAQTYTLTHDAAVSTSGTANDWFYAVWPGTVQHPETVTVPAGGSADVQLTITSPAAEEGEMSPIFGGYVNFTPEGEDVEPYTVAYGGHSHDLQEVEVLADMVDGDGNVVQELPTLGYVASCSIWLGNECVDPNGSYGAVDGYRVFTMTQEDHPNFLIHFEHQARNMVWNVYEANEDGSAGAHLGRALEVDYLGRSATRNGFSAYVWDGMVINEATQARERVESGDYVMKIDVTKASAFNDDREPGVESWTSQAFGIDWSGEGLVDSPDVTRVLGHDRFATASELAVMRFEPGVGTVFIANGYNYPDAVAGGALAVSDEGPVLLTRTGNLPAPTRMALQDLRPERIVVLGGTEVVDGDVMAALGDYAPVVERLAGEDRYETAVEISNEWASSDVVFLASGQDYPDALSAAAAAGVNDAPVLLTRQQGLSRVTAAELARLSPATVYVIGGEEAVSRDAAEAADAYAGEVVRLGGDDRYGTASIVGQEFFPTPTNEALMATGLDFPDALAAAPAAALAGGPVLLTHTDRVPVTTQRALDALRVQNITLVGGYDAISYEVQQFLEGVVYP